MDEIEKIESVGEVDKTSKNKMPAEEPLSDEALAAEQEKFQSLISTEKTESTQFKKVDNRWEVETPEQTTFEAKKKEVTPSNMVEKTEAKREGVDKVEGTTAAQAPSSATSIAEQAGELKSQIKNIGDISPADIQAQSKELINKLESLKKQLASTKGEIKPSYQKVLEHRLTHIDDSLKVALSKVGGEYNAPSDAARSPNPVERFINLAAHGQHQLENLDKTIEQLQIGGATLTPANMLVLQIKVNEITRQVDLFASLLNKSLESVKQIMSVQV